MGDDEFLAQARENSALDVDLLLMEATALDRIALLTESERMVAPDAQARFLELLERRAQHEPIAYILGRREFYGRSFTVDPAVLIPRPETELLVECALRSVRELLGNGARKLLLIDVGTGSGAIIITTLLELNPDEAKRITAIAVDISEDALAIARANAAHFGVSPSFTQSNLLEAIGDLSNYDRLVIVSNPPYIEDAAKLPADVANYEPALALFGGDDGLRVVAELIEQSFSRLSKIPGALLFEIGSGQADKVVSLLPDCPAHECQLLEDLQGVRRVCSVRVGLN